MGISLKDMALILSKESDATLTLAATMLDELAFHLKSDSDNYFVHSESIHQVLKRYRTSINEQTGSPSFSHLFVIAANGYNVANTVSFPVKRVDASGRKYFIHHRDNPGTSLHISQPINSLVTGERVIYLTRRLSNQNGAFSGVVGIQLKLSHFDRIYQQLELPPQGSVAVIRTDGLGIYRYPLVESFLKTSVNTRADFKQMLQQRQGFIHTVATPYDGYDRLIGFRISEKFPIINLITITEDSLLQHWLENSLKILLLATFAGATLLLMAYFIYQQLGFLEHAIHLSNHDPLTSLSNRRALDEHLDKEWRRVRRRDSEMSLLFIDIDHFKDYNDFYGHRKGDICLKKIADAILSCATRSGEMVSRYGGEEFIVVLPEIDQQTAYQTAQRILQTVLDLNIPHAKSLVSEKITVSIGVATLRASGQHSLKDLIDFADEALYQAKQQGRNRVCRFESEKLNT